jgi:hypothetical protein
MFPCHNIPEDLDSLREIVKDIMTTLSSQRMPTITPQSKLNSGVASWNKSHKPAISVSFVLFEDNVGEDRLSSQSTYKENIEDPYYIPPNPK